MNSARLSKKEYFLETVKLVASRSTCPRRSVGCIITDSNGHVLSTGYNGVPSGYLHCIDTPCPGVNGTPGNSDNCVAVHAEQNALLQCSSLDRATTMYCTNLPCFICSKMIANTNIREIYCLEDYADHRGLELLMNLGVEVFTEGELISVKEIS